MSSFSILVAEEDPAIRTFLADNLSADGYTLHTAANTPKAVRTIAEANVQLVICDLNGAALPLVDRVRDGHAHADPNLPVLVLTGRSDELARVRVFDRGGDDVLVKPFSYPELRGRVRALLRRTYQTRPATRTRLDGLSIDTATRQVHVDERPVELSKTEFAVLCALAVNPVRVHTRRELMLAVWGREEDPSGSRRLDSHAYRLRQKLNPDRDRRYVHNVWGVGYRLTLPA